MEVRGQLSGGSPFLPSGQVWVLNSGCQAPWQVPLLTDPSSQEKTHYICENLLFLLHFSPVLLPCSLADTLYPNLESWCQAEDTTFHRKTNLLVKMMAWPQFLSFTHVFISMSSYCPSPFIFCFFNWNIIASLLPLLPSWPFPLSTIISLEVLLT